MSVRVFTLPGLRCVADDRELTALPGQKLRAALLVYLAVERQTTRELLLGVFWPERPPDRARKALSQMLYELGTVELRQPFVEPRGDFLHALPDLHADAVEFADAVQRSDTETALALYGGTFLDGVHLVDTSVFENWVDRKRMQLARLHRRARAERIGALRAAGDLAGALANALRWAELEPLEEGAHQRVIELYALSGQPAEAERHFAAHEQQLRREGLEPVDETRELITRIRNARTAAPPPAAAAVPPVPPPRGPPGPDGIESDLRGLAPELEVQRLLGRGSMALVYLAREPALGRLVALKVLAPELASDDIARRRFEREAQSAARILHPGVATVHRIGRTAGGLPWLVMPFYDAGTLEDRIASEGALPIAVALAWFAQLAGALAAAHRLGIVHRDLRPANILLDRASGGVVLTDFGLAAVLESGAAAALRLTSPGQVLGVAAWASPEQLRGEEVTERADVYSLGVIAFQLFTGRLPYDASKTADHIRATLGAEPARVRDLRPEAPPGIDALIGRCLKKKPEHRPFAAEIVELLDPRRPVP